MNTVEKIDELLRCEFKPETLEITDDSWKHAGHAGAQESGGGHFSIQISSSRFKGLSRMQSHRLIYHTLQSLFPSGIHALSIKAEESSKPG